MFLLLEQDVKTSALAWRGETSLLFNILYHPPGLWRWPDCPNERNQSSWCTSSHMRHRWSGMTSRELWRVPKVLDVGQTTQQTACVLATSSAFIHVNLNEDNVPRAKIDVLKYTIIQSSGVGYCRGLAVFSNQVKLLKRHVWCFWCFCADPCSFISVKKKS